jgi:hypothetical protein
MKNFLILSGFLALHISTLWAQNYQSIHPEKVYTYQFTDQGVSFIRVVSAEESEAGTALHFAPNIQEVGFNCYDIFGATWLGPKVIVQENGDNLFFNETNDTIRIRTQANEGEPWIVYQDENRIIQSRVAEIKLSEIHGQPDSVKVIEFRVFTSHMEETEHPLNNKTMELSKNFGLTKILPLLRFPDMTIYYEEIFESSLLGISDPALGIRNITWLDVMDFEPGDEIHIVEKTRDADLDHNTLTHRTINSILRYLERTDFSDSIIYRKERIISDKTNITPGDITTEIFTHDTIPKSYAKCDYFNVYAGEPVLVDNPYSNFTHWQSGSKILNYRFFDGDEHCNEEVHYDGCFPMGFYSRGLGGPYFYCDDFFHTSSRELVFYKKGDQTWGTPLVILSTPETSIEQLVSVYPNPANDRLWVSLPAGLSYVIFELMDLTGKVVVRERIDQGENIINLGNISPGIYLYRLADAKDLLQSGKIVLLR